MNLYNLLEIEIELRATADAACADGVNSLLKSKEITIEEFITNKEKYAIDFINFCHEGFKVAQDRIIKNVLLIQEEQALVSGKLKKARQEKNKAQIADLIKKDKHLGHIVILFKHCADALAWQLFHGQLWISRRLYLKVWGEKKLKEVNLRSVKMVADQINSNPMNFVLITDLTNNVQVGDLIGLIDGEFVITEVKEGKKNFEILKVIKDLGNNETTLKEVIEKHKTEPKFLNHLQRTLKQHMTIQSVHEILSTDQGMDPVLKQTIKIQTPKEYTPVYTEKLSALQKQLEDRKFWAYDVIDECLHIGIYKGEKRFAGPLILKTIAEHNNPNYIIVDILTIYQSLNKPIFFLPFSPDFIFDIIFERIKMYFMLDLDKYIDLYKNFGFIAKWATRKETAETSDILHEYEIFKFKNRGIKIKTNAEDKGDMWMSYGTLTRIFFEQIYPSYTAYSTKYYLGNQ